MEEEESDERRLARREDTAVQRLTRAAVRATATSEPWRRAAASDRRSKRWRGGRGLDRGCWGEARREAASDRATTASGPARLDRGAALMAPGGAEALTGGPRHGKQRPTGGTLRQ
jgi:hypothetical protein